MGINIHISICNGEELALALQTYSVVSGKGDVRIFSDGFNVSESLFGNVVNLPKMRSSVTGDLSWFQRRISGLDKGVLLLDADTTVFDIPEFPEDAVSCPCFGRVCTSNVMYIPHQFQGELVEYCNWFAENRKALGKYQDPYLTAAIKRLKLKVNDISDLLCYHPKGGKVERKEGCCFAHHNHGNPILSNE